MDEMTQPQVVEEANQPNITSGDAAIGGTTEIGQDWGSDTPFLTIRYNKQDKPLSREEAAVYAQKGMNYDKLSEKLKAADDQLKRLNGLDVSAKHTTQDAIPKGELQGAEVWAGSTEQEIQAEVSAQLDAFVEAYPDVDPGALPKAVLNAWKRGIPLREAYDSNQINELAGRLREMERQTRAKEANESNAAASMGGAGNVGAVHPQPITDEAIQTMSPAELEKNHARIWAYLTGDKS